jgi:hypothetical protein
MAAGATSLLSQPVVAQPLPQQQQQPQPQPQLQLQPQQPPQQPGPTLMLIMFVERDGVVVSSPRVWTSDVQGATIQVGSDLRMDVTTREQDRRVDIAIDVLAPRDGTWAKVQRTQAVSDGGERASLTFTTSDGAVYKVGVLPFRMGAGRGS